MNAEHQVFCSSADWSDYLRDFIAGPLLSGLDLGDEMLEVGPGPGAATEFLRHRVQSLTALELDASAAEALAIRFAGTNVKVIAGDCTSAGLPDESFDSIATFTMLHHIPSATLQHAVLAEAFRMLRPGGCLVGSDSLASDGLHQFHAGDTYNPVEPVWLLVQLRTLGFKPIMVRLGDEFVFSALKPVRTLEGGNPMKMKLPYQEPLVPLQPGPRQIPEPPRRGEPGGPPCGICSANVTDAVWSDDNWTLHPPVGGSLPGTVWLASRVHADSFGDLPADVASDFGRVVGRVERAILSLGGVGRVHLYRWGDGGAHFHVWLLPRPLGMLEASGMMLPLWEDVLPNVSDQELADAARRVAERL